MTVAYYIPCRKKLTNYLPDASLGIDNNFAVNAIHLTAPGRKNYLFDGSERSVKKAAVFYSFFGTCKKNNVNPFLQEIIL